MENESNSKSLVKNSFWNFLMISLGKIGGFIFVILLARYLLPEGFGVYNLTIYIALFFIMFADSGINQTLLKFFTENFYNDLRGSISIYRYLFKLKIILSVLLSIMLILLAYPISIMFHKPEIFIPLLFGSLYILAFSIESFFISFFYVFKKVKYLAARQLIWECLRVLLLIIVFSAINKSNYIIAAILILVFSTTISILFLLYSIRKICPDLFKKNVNCLTKNDKQKLKGFWFYIGVLNIINLIFGYVEIIILGFFVSSTFIGYYTAAWTLIGGFSALFGISNILLPLFSQHKDNLKNSISLIAKYISVITIPIIFGIFLFGSYIISLAYGYEYIYASVPLFILAIIIFESPLTGMLNSLFSANAKQTYLVRLAVFSLFINIFLNFIIISLVKPSFSIILIIVSCVVVFSRMFYFISASIYSSKVLKSDLKFVNFLLPIISASIMFCSLYFFNNLLNIQMNLYIGLVEIISGAILYFICMFLFKGLTKEDLIFIKNLFKK